MTQAKPKPLTFAEFLERDDGNDVRYDLLADGSLIEVPDEAPLNTAISFRLALHLAALISDNLIKLSCLTLQVEPVGDNHVNRRPDLTVLTPKHLGIDSFTRRATLFLGAPPPRFVAEVVSPGNTDSSSYQRDYVWKRQQYQDWGIPEYWIIDPHRQQVTVLVLSKGLYQEKIYREDDQIRSTEFPYLDMVASDLLGS